MLKETKEEVSGLNNLKEKIYKEQFHDWEEDTHAAEDVLTALQNLKENPILLSYIIKCLNKQGISTSPSRFYYIEIQKYIYDHYLPLAELQRKEGRPKGVNKTVIKKVFKNNAEAEECMKDVVLGPDEKYIILNF